MNLSTSGKVTATINQEATLFATQVTLLGVGGAQGGCNEGYFGPFFANFTQQVEGTLTSTQIINFYIMNSTQYSAFYGNGCDPRLAKGAVYMNEQTNSVALYWTAPKKGLYYLVFTTGSYSDAIIVANLGTPIHVVTSYLQYVTLSNFLTGGVTETITSISLSQLGQPSQIPTGLIEFVLVILAGMIAIGLWKRRRA